MRRLLLLVASCLLIACAQQSRVQLHAGPPLPPSQVVTLTVPGELEVQSINGQRVPAANAFGTGARELLLAPGAYQVHAYYKQGFDIDGGIRHEVVRGRTAIFDFRGEPGELWHLQYTEPQNLQEARHFETEFSAWVVNTRTGERVAGEPGPRNNSLISALLGGADEGSDSTVAPLGAATSPAARPAAAAVAPAPAAPAPAPTAQETLPHNDATLTTLQQLWNLLSPESREAFLEWVRQ